MQETNAPHIEGENSIVTKEKQCSKRKTIVIKTIVGLFVVCTIVLFLCVGAISVLHLKSVQTYLIGKVTEKLEETLQANVSIAQFHYRPLSRLYC